VPSVVCFQHSETQPPSTPTPTPIPHTTLFATTPDLFTTDTPRIAPTTTADNDSGEQSGSGDIPDGSTVPPITGSQDMLCTNGVTDVTGVPCACADSACVSCSSNGAPTCYACNQNLVLSQGKCVGTCPAGSKLSYDAANTTLICKSTCPSGIPSYSDILFMIDSSASIGPASYLKGLALIKDIVGDLPLGSADSQHTSIALVNFAEQTDVDFQFIDSRMASNADLQAQVGMSTYQGTDKTSLLSALNLAYVMYTDPRSGARTGDHQKRALVLLTDGFSSETNLVNVLFNLDSIGVKLYVVAMGAEVNKPTLELIAHGHPFSLNDQSAAKNLALSLGCTLFTPPPTGEPTIICTQGHTAHSQEACDCGLGCSACQIKGGVRQCTSDADGSPFTAFDLITLLDASDAMLGGHQATILLSNIFGALALGPRDVRVALASYAEETQLHFKFDQYLDIDTRLAATQTIQLARGQADAAGALDDVKAHLVWSTVSGIRTDVPKKLFLVTSGSSVGDSAADAVAQLRRTGVDVFVLGVGVTNVSALARLTVGVDRVFVVQDSDMLTDPGFAAVILKALKTPAPLPTTAAPNTPDGAAFPTGSPLLYHPGQPIGEAATASPTATAGEEFASESAAAASSVVQGASPQSVFVVESASNSKGSSSSSSGSSSSSSPVGVAIFAAAGVVGAVAVVALVGMVAWRRSQQQQAQQAQQQQQAPPALPPRLTKAKMSDADLLTSHQHTPSGPGPLGEEPLGETLSRRH
jgi:hypothetical protein